MFNHYIFWLWFAGTVILVLGLFAVRKDLLAASKLDRLIVLGPVFVAAPLAAFGAEHMVSAVNIQAMVPRWMPAHLFWAYFVGFALIAAAISLSLRKYVRLSAPLLGAMLLLFVLSLHVPNVMKNPRDRFAWAVALRDTAFAGGALALAATQTGERRRRGASWLTGIARAMIVVPVLFFAVEHLLHPEFAPGVPLPMTTPAWIPLRVVWGYLTGAFLLAGGAGMLVTKYARAAAAWLGAELALVVLFIYVPILAAAAEPPQMTVGINYVADTLLFAGAVLLLGAAMPKWENS